MQLRLKVKKIKYVLQLVFDVLNGNFNNDVSGVFVQESLILNSAIIRKTDQLILHLSEKAAGTTV